MVVAEQEARVLFEALDPGAQIPSLSPAFVGIDAVRDAELEPIHWVYREEACCYYVGLHRTRIPATEYFDLQTPYQYGGPIVHGSRDGFLGRAWTEYARWCVEAQVVVELMRFHPMLQNGATYQGNVSYNRPAVYVDLNAGDLFKGYETRVRTSIRKALAHGLGVEWRTGTEHTDLFMRLYYATMEDRGAAAFYFFPREYFERLLAWDQARMAICFAHGEPVAAAIILFGPQVSEYHLSCANAEGKRLGATDLILHEAAELSLRRSCKAFYLGGGYDSNPQNSLLFFKAGHSSQRASFCIGSWVHHPQRYRELQAKFSAAYEENPGRVLFYR